MYSIIFFIESVDFSTEGEARTPDTWFWRPVLYRLSYFRNCVAKVVLYFEYPSIKPEKTRSSVNHHDLQSSQITKYIIAQNN